MTTLSLSLEEPVGQTSVREIWVNLPSLHICYTRHGQPVALCLVSCGSYVCVEFYVSLFFTLCESHGDGR